MTPSASGSRCTIITKASLIRRCRIISNISWNLRGGSRSILGGDAVSAIHGYSEGNARKIDNLMTDALTIGAQQDKPTIDAEDHTGRS